MSNLIPFENTKPLAIPSALAELFGATSNISAYGESFPTISIRGKSFTLVKGQDSKKITTTDEDGNELAVQSLKVVILDHAPKRARAYFDKEFDGETAVSPLCHSFDGERPATDAKEPQASKCESCEMSVKGSKINAMGKATTACSMSRRLAIIPSNDLKAEPLFLRLPVTSLYDPNNENENNFWFAYDAYQKFLVNRGVSHTAMVQTTMRFDQNSDYPKLLFKATGLLDEDSAKTLLENIKANRENIDHMLGLDRINDGTTTVEVERKEAQEEPPAPKPEKEEPKTRTRKSKPALVTEDEEPAPKPAREVVLKDDEGDSAIKDALSNWD